MTAAIARYRLGLLMDVLADAGEPLDVATLMERTRLTRAELAVTLAMARRRGLVVHEGALRKVVLLKPS